MILEAAPVGGEGELSEIAESVLSSMNKEINPCEDFYQYSCGGWLSSNTIPADRPSWGRGFSVIAERNERILREILESSWPLISDYYTACMKDTGDVASLAPFLAIAARVATPADALYAAGQLRSFGVGAFLGMSVSADPRNPDVNLLDYGQGGLSLPSRTYYLEQSKEKVDLRAALAAHIATMYGLSGAVKDAKVAEAKASGVLAFETELAKLHLPPAELRDPVKTYNKYNRTGLLAQSELPWQAYWNGTGVSADAAGFEANLDTPAYFVSLAALLKATKPEVLQDYLAWHVVHAGAAITGPRTREETHAFYGAKLSGQDQMPVAWKRCVRSVDGALGEQLGRIYVSKQFPAASRDYARKLIERIEESFRVNLPQVDWMDDQTRKLAETKLGMVTNKIGSPDKPKTYSGMAVTATDEFANAVAARKFAYAEMIQRIGQPVDKTLWDMHAPEVNAYYNPNGNEMVFPAGIIQPTFFNASYPPAMNFGGIGSVMGHELTHGFDDQGAQFDGTGRLKDWWPKPVTEAFKNRTKCVVDLYSTFEVNGRKVDGSLTQGENIADMGGVKAAYRAYKSFAKEFGAEAAQLIPGITADQLFFIAYSQSWCTLRKPQSAEQLLLTDPHSPPMYRVNGPLSNFDEFAEVWKCKPGTKMNPVKKCTVW
jgi:putative endopeptidase